MLKVRALAVVAALALLVPGGADALAAQGPSLATLRAAGASEIQDVTVRLPNTAASAVPSDQPLQVLVALHGMGGNGADFGNALATQADAHNWVIVAPTIAYGDWTNPAQIAQEEPALIAWLSNYLATLNQRIDAPIASRVLLFGHSRGAQLALRFTEVHPEQVAGVAAVSAGTYTLPESQDASSGGALNYPFGVANLAQSDGGQAFDRSGFDAVPIWLAVGGADNNAADVPSAWTPYLGTTRVARAQRFARVLQTVGADVSLTIFPNTDHTLTDEMRAAGCSALATDQSARDASLG
jgi:pimeloyl-ACP methyl ester carboxylesterase